MFQGLRQNNNSWRCLSRLLWRHTHSSQHWPWTTCTRVMNTWPAPSDSHYDLFLCFRTVSFSWCVQTTTHNKLLTSPWTQLIVVHFSFRHMTVDTWHIRDLTKVTPAALPALWSPAACCSAPGCRAEAAAPCRPPATPPYEPVPSCASGSETETNRCSGGWWDSKLTKQPGL